MYGNQYGQPYAGNNMGTMGTMGTMGAMNPMIAMNGMSGGLFNNMFLFNGNAITLQTRL